MAYFEPVEVLRFIPESYLPSVPYIPLHFVAQRRTLDATNFQYEIDSNGETSIIRLNTNGETLIPFVDLSKYDSETKDFFWYNPENDFPFRFLKSYNTLENLYPSTYSGLVLSSDVTFNKDTIRLEAEFTHSNGTVTFYKYSPLILTVNNQAYDDLSDYANFKSTDRLNKVDDTIPEFYYDFDSRIYTNQNFAGINPEQVRIHFFQVSDNSVTVKCRMSTNSGTDSYYTPRVNSYIVKLKGQSLRT